MRGPGNPKQTPEREPKNYQNDTLTNNNICCKSTEVKSKARENLRKGNNNITLTRSSIKPSNIQKRGMILHPIEFTKNLNFCFLIREIEIAMPEFSAMLMIEVAIDLNSIYIQNLNVRKLFLQTCAYFFSTSESDLFVNIKKIVGLVLSISTNNTSYKRIFRVLNKS